MPIEVKLDQISSKEWNEFVRAHPQGNIFQTQSLFDVYSATENYHPVMTSLTNSKTGDVVGILSGVTISEMKGIASKISSHAVVQGGPLTVDLDKVNIANRLVQEFDKKVRRKAIYSEIRNMWEVMYLNDNLNSYSFEDHLDFLIDLEQTMDSLWGGLSKSRRKNINKAKELGIYIEEMTDIGRMDTFYNLIKETYDDVGIPCAPRSLFLNAFSQLAPKGFAKFFLAFHSNDCIGARAVLTYNGMIYDWYAGASKFAQSYNPNDHLVWHILKWGMDNGYSIFDFGGAGDPNKPYGPREFKRRFGGKMVNYGRYVRVYSPVKLKLARTGLKMYQTFTKPSME
jgi:serine/alanine adding enzyme